MEAKDYIARLNEINSEKLALLDELFLFSKSQRDAILSGRLDELETLITEKQHRMDAIDRLDEKFVVYAERLKKMLSISSFQSLADYGFPGTRELKELVEKIHQKLTEIKALDDENTALVKKELQATKEQINHSNTFKRVNNAYYPEAKDIPSHYFDTKK